MCVLPRMQDRTANKGKKVDELKRKKKKKRERKGEKEEDSL